MMMLWSLTMVALVAYSRAASRETCRAPRTNAANMPMIVIVTNNSVSVKPEEKDLGFGILDFGLGIRDWGLGDGQAENRPLTNDH
jgi:hypothetical protein